MKNDTIFLLFFTILLLSIVTQQHFLNAASQKETQEEFVSIDIDLSDTLGEREEKYFSGLRESQDELLSTNNNTSSNYIQLYGDSYKEKILILYPALRNALYMAYPDIPQAAPIKTYIKTFEQIFRNEAKLVNQDYYDFVRDREELSPGFTFSLRNVLLFEVPFYSDELRIVSFYKNIGTWGNSGSDAYTVLLFLKDGTELDYQDIFIDYNQALILIAETVALDLMQTFTEEGLYDLELDKWVQEGTAPTPENYHKKIAFTQNGDMLVYFDKYQVAPGASGTQQSTVAYSTIEPLLSDTMKQLLNK